MPTFHVLTHQVQPLERVLSLWQSQTRSWPTFSLKSQMVNLLGFAKAIWSLLLLPHFASVAVDNMGATRRDWIP